MARTVHDVIRHHTVLDLGPLPAPRLPPTATVHQAVQMLVRGRRGAVVVVEGSRPVGIFTERDLLYRLSREVLSSAEDRRRLPLRDVMTSPPVTVERRTSLSEAIDAMFDHRYRHLVVVDGSGDLRGLLTTGDVVQFLTDQFPEQTVNLPPRLHQHYARPEGG